MYDVGQVLYVILEKKRVILPVRVSEQIVRRSSSGETVTYRVEIPGKDQVVSLSDLSQSHFSSLEEVNRELLSNAEQMILTMTQKARAIAKEFFDVREPGDIAIPTPISTNEVIEHEEKLKVDLPDGTVGVIGKVDLSALDKGVE